MIASILVPAVIMIIGLIVWLMASNPVAKEAGRIWFFVGSLWLCYVLSSSTMHFQVK